MTVGLLGDLERMTVAEAKLGGDQDVLDPPGEHGRGDERRGQSRRLGEEQAVEPGARAPAAAAVRAARIARPRRLEQQAHA